MTSIAHVMTGAFVASKLGHPALYIPVTVVLHYIEDWCPHWDFGTGLTSGKRSRKTALVLGILDLAIGLGMVYFFWQKDFTQMQWHIWIGAIAGILPDLLEAPKNFLKINPWPLKPLNDFHDAIHQSIPSIALGIAPQLVVVGTILFLR